MSPSRRTPPGSLRSFVAAAVVFAVAVATHHEVLGYWFTGSDTLTLIERSRMADLEGALTVLTSPLMYGTSFAADIALFYRPVANLSYALDYWVWGLDPFGYHLTDLLLHAIAAALVFGSVRALTGSDATGLLAGGVFATHPATAAVVPTPARRHDVLATVFVLCSVLLFVRALRGVDASPGSAPDRDDTAARTGAYVAGSVLGYVFALGSKELAAVLPVILASWFLLVAYGREYTSVETLRRGALLATPYAVATAGYLGWRVTVLGGLGGYKPGPWVPNEPVGRIGARYVLDLLYPVDVLGIGALLPRLPGNVRFLPDALYVVLAVVCAALLAVLLRTDRPGSLLASRRGRALAFFGTWAAAPMALFAYVGTFDARSGYLAVVPTAAIAAILLCGSGRDLVDRVRRTRRADPLVVAAVVLAGALVVSLAAGSPLVHSYDGWERSGEIAADALPAAADAYASEDLPPNAVVALAGLPHRTGSPPPVAQPRERSITHFYANTVASWIRLQHPESAVATHVGGPMVVFGDRNVTDVTVAVAGSGTRYRMIFRYETRPTSGAATRGTDGR